MNRKITKSMAAYAASVMSKKAYNGKIEAAKAGVNVAAEILAQKYIPRPVIAIVNEYSSFIDYTSNVVITTTVERNGYTTTATDIKAVLSFKVPCKTYYIKVERNEYDDLLKLDNKRKQLVDKYNEFQNKVYEALIALRTEKAVEKELPEALKYLEFPEVKAVPAPVFTGLRELIKSIN